MQTRTKDGPLPTPLALAATPKLLPMASAAPSASLNFKLPPELEAGEPPEARGLARDAVRLMVSYRDGDRIAHAHFNQLPDFLSPGDLLVINTSGTLNAALPATRADGSPLELHLSTHLPAGLWSVELRRPGQSGSLPFFDVTAGETLALPEGAALTLLAPRGAAPARLWIAALRLPGTEHHKFTPLGTCHSERERESQELLGASRARNLNSVIYCGSLNDYLSRCGFPIRYGYVKEQWPLSYYQTVYATEMGSAEMPSAGRGFTCELITRLVASGVQIAPLVLHTGVASLEAHEPPYEEYYRVPLATAQAVNSARAASRRVIAVGTTVVRALETVTDEQGRAHPAEGWTSLVITRERGLRAVNSLLTGLHEPAASHLAMLEALAGLPHLQLTYAEALRERYLWHEFGDLHLILP